MKLNVVLYCPEIPQNTGNIMRTCVAANAKLHLIKPLGFSLDEAHLKRAAVNYIEYLDYTVYESLEDFQERNHGNFYYLTRYGHKNPNQIDFKNDLKVNNQDNIYLMFGKESTGIPYDVLADHLDSCIRIPSTDHVRSMNLSNCVAIMVFEALRQFDYEGLYKEEPDTLKGHDFIDKFKEN